MIDDDFRAAEVPDGMGTLWGVSVGPGAPDLITLRAHRVLTESAVIAWPACKPRAGSYAWRVIEEYIDTDKQQTLGLVFPMNKDWSSLVPVWEDSARQILAHLRAGRDVAFITTGDAMLYSTFLHVWEVVREMEPEAPIRVIPGVSSINAASALTSVPLGQGDERVAIVPATWHEDRLRELLDDTDTVVLMKVARVLPQVIDLLEETGRLSQAVLVSRGTAEQQIVTRDLARFRERRLNYLTLVIVARSRPFLERLRSESESDARFAVNRQGETA